MKFTATSLYSLCGGNSKYTDYKVVGTEKVTKVIRCKIPYTSHKKHGSNEISDYLKGFEKYYNECRYFFELKDEYKENRPEYEITVTYELFDIELTEKGRKYCERRANIHKRNLEKYLAFLG